MKKLILIITAVLMLLGCEKTTSPERYENELHFLTGIIKVGEFVNSENPVRIGTTVSAEEGNVDDLIDPNITVKLQKIKNGIVETEVDLGYLEESSSFADLDEMLEIIPNTRYRIIGYFLSGDSIWAETITPDLIEVVADSLVNDNSAFTGTVPEDEWAELVYDEADELHPLQVITQNNNELYLYNQFYCLETYDNAKFLNPGLGDDYPADEDEYSNAATGYPQRVETFFEYQPTNNLVSMGFYQSNLMFYGKHEVTVYSIDQNYFRYLYLPEGFNDAGVHNGIGIFGSSCGKKLFTEIVE